jgi:hypothetical protein
MKLKLDGYAAERLRLEKSKFDKQPVAGPAHGIEWALNRATYEQLRLLDLWWETRRPTISDEAPGSIAKEVTVALYPTAHLSEHTNLKHKLFSTIADNGVTNEIALQWILGAVAVYETLQEPSAPRSPWM